MKKILFFILIIALYNQAGLAQSTVFNPDDPVITYDPSHPPVIPSANKIVKWVRTKVYTWNTDNFKCYYINGMAFRLRFPTGYNPSNTTRKYPVIVFYHGGGEVAPNTDNETQLFFTAQKFEAMADQGQYNSFLLYPVLSQDGIWEDTHFSNVNQILDTLQKYCNADLDRVLTMGLSMGGFASLRYSAWYPQRSSLSISSSPALIETLPDASKNSLLTIPMWVGYGGMDINPLPLYVTNFINYITAKGGNIRQTFYPDQGHQMWFSQYDEPYLLPYMLAAHKANPTVYFGRNQFSKGTPISSRLGLTDGFYAYEWQKDNVTIATGTNGVLKIIDQSVISAYTGAEITVNAVGTYRARFKRTASSNWSDWSPNPVVVQADNTAPAAPANLKTTFDGRTSIDLTWDRPADNSDVAKYDVYVNGTYRASTTGTNITIDNLTPNTSYSYAVKALDKANNMSAFSNTITVSTSASGLYYKYYKGSWAALPDFTSMKPDKFGVSPNIDLSTRPSGDETNYAFVWQGYINIRTAGNYTFETISDDGSKFLFNTLNPSDVPLVNNDGIHGSTTVSATVNNLAAGIYPVCITFFQKELVASVQLYWTGPGITRQLVPDGAFDENYQDNIAPAAPTNLKTNYIGRTQVDLTWNQSTDNLGVAKYNVYVDNVFKLSTAATSASIDNLTPDVNHYFEVKALDQAGNISTAGSLSATTKANGLKYKYYEGSWAALPDFSTLTPVRTGQMPNVAIVPRNINDNFGFLWEGYINIKTPGTYTFETFSDDGSKLYFNSFYTAKATPLVNNDGEHPVKSASGSVYIATAGYYPIAITYYEKEGTEWMQLFWQGPNFSRQLVPDAAFTETSSTGASLDEQGSAAVANGLIPEENKLVLASAYPNPFSKELKISFTNSSNNNKVSIGIYDLAGKLLYGREYGKLAAGVNTLNLPFEGQQLVAGTYLARLQVNGVAVKTWKLVKMKK